MQASSPPTLSLTHCDTPFGTAVVSNAPDHGLVVQHKALFNQESEWNCCGMLLRNICGRITGLTGWKHNQMCICQSAWLKITKTAMLCNTWEFWGLRVYLQWVGLQDKERMKGAGPSVSVVPKHLLWVECWGAAPHICTHSFLIVLLLHQHHCLLVPTKDHPVNPGWVSEDSPFLLAGMSAAGEMCCPGRARFQGPG